MRLLVTIAALAFASKPASACEFEHLRGPYPASFTAAPRSPTLKGGLRVVPAGPSFYGFPGDPDHEVLPVFRRLDGSIVPSAGEPVERTSLRRIKLGIDEGVIVVTYPGLDVEPAKYVVDARYAPRTRGTRLERDRTDTWLRVDSDAIALRIDRANGTSDTDMDVGIVLLTDDKLRVVAIYSDGRQEVIFERPASWHPPHKVAAPPAKRSTGERWPLVLLLGALVLGAAIARRVTPSAGEA